MDEPRYFVYHAQARFPSPQSYQIKFASSLRRKVNRDTSKAKSTYFTPLIEQAKGNSKEMWNHLKKIFPSKSNDKSSGSAVLMRDGVSITEPKARAKCLNEFFTSIGRTLAARFNPTIACFSPQRSSTCTSIFQLQNIRQDFVLNQLSYLKPNKAIGLDNVSTRLLKVELQSWHQCWPVSSTSQLHLSNFRHHGNVLRAWPSLNLAKKPCYLYLQD